MPECDGIRRNTRAETVRIVVGCCFLSTARSRIVFWFLFLLRPNRPFVIGTFVYLFSIGLSASHSNLATKYRVQCSVFHRDITTNANKFNNSNNNSNLPPIGPSFSANSMADIRVSYGETRRYRALAVRQVSGELSSFLSRF